MTNSLFIPGGAVPQYHKEDTDGMCPLIMWKGSKSDLYVTLTLPTATATTRRTKTINNNNCPEWNEGFSFRVPTQTKNVLEISVFDEDLLSRDDLVSTVLLDLGTLDMDSSLSKVFSLSPEVRPSLSLISLGCDGIV